MTDAESPEERAKKIKAERRKRLEDAVLPGLSSSFGYCEPDVPLTSLNKIKFIPDYDFLLKKDEWSEKDIESLFDIDEQNNEQFWELLYSSIEAKKLKPSRVIRHPCLYGELSPTDYFFCPIDMINWAISKQIAIPSELSEFHKEQCHEKDFISSKEQHHLSNEIIQADQAKGITQTERQTMLKLIIGMAIDAYGYDPKALRNQATGDKNGISARLKVQGININDDTIRKYLTEAKELL